MNAGSLTRGLDLSPMRGPSGGIDLASGQAEAQSASSSGDGGGGGPTLTGRLFISNVGTVDIYEINPDDGSTIATQGAGSKEFWYQDINSVGVLAILQDTANRIEFYDFTDGVSQTAVNGPNGATFLASPSGNIEGVGYDNDDALWALSSSTSTFYKYVVGTGWVSQFAHPTGSGAVHAATFDAEGNLWSTDRGTDLIYKINATTGATITSFAPPATDVYDMSFGPDGNLWVNVFGNDTIYELNPADGTTVSSITGAWTVSLGLSWYLTEV